jgi:hypothetical protein
MGRVIVFDVIETSLDLAALDEYFERVFHDPAARQDASGMVRPDVAIGLCGALAQRPMAAEGGA